MTRNGSSVEPVPEDEAVMYVHQIAKAMQKLHAKYVVHRDLCIDAVKVKVKRDRTYLLLDKFDFALQLKKNHTV